MFEFISQIIMMLSLGVILYLVARSLPRITEDSSPSIQKAGWLTINLEKADKWLKSLLEKFLRYFNVQLLKISNGINRKLSRFKKEETHSQNGSDLFSQKKE